MVSPRKDDNYCRKWEAQTGDKNMYSEYTLPAKCFGETKIDVKNRRQECTLCIIHNYNAVVRNDVTVDKF